ncbi:hypothetical protein L5B71_08570 [Avibacterium sp. 21-586]|uniref:hypothetical protein n=1 Tax=Avibacterium sp. 21-586 TaxID=2911534 RepID=UPI0022454BC1|nr:hypothetical protein [Avibacterium sp. 21-586]MCW9710888.1 hypothetical protein [Avibacterium sp. 21-586]
MLKESDLIEDHEYIGKNAKRVWGILPRRKIFKVNHTEGYVLYCQYKGIKSGGVMATMKTISIKSFLRWAVADITDTKKLEKANETQHRSKK